jgi:hypothetical protein
LYIIAFFLKHKGSYNFRHGDFPFSGGRPANPAQCRPKALIGHPKALNAHPKALNGRPKAQNEHPCLVVALQNTKMV